MNQNVAYVYLGSTEDRGRPEEKRSLQMRDFTSEWLGAENKQDS